MLLKICILGAAILTALAFAAALALYLLAVLD